MNEKHNKEYSHKDKKVTVLLFRWLLGLTCGRHRIDCTKGFTLQKNFSAPQFNRITTAELNFSSLNQPVQYAFSSGDNTVFLKRLKKCKKEQRKMGLNVFPQCHCAFCYV